MKYDHCVGRLIFTLSVWFTLSGAAWPLHPLVTRNPQPAGPVPPECEQGLAPAPMPRVVVAEIPRREEIEEIRPAAVPVAPPSRTLRNTLEEAHAALVGNDRPAFDAALANARLIVRDYPPGGERAAAEEALRVYDDAALLWEAQFESPFFNENTEAYARVSRYPGYGEAVRRGILTDDADRRFYPAAESRDFLTRLAAERLNRLGVRTTTRVARGERPRSPASVSPSRRSTTAASTTASASPRRGTRRTPARRTASTSTPTTTRKSATPAMSAPASPDPPAPARAVAASAPAASPAAAPTPAAPAPSPVAEGQPTEDVPAATPAPAETDTALTTPSTATTAPAPATTAAPAPERRSILVPAILIAIGLGVLIVLFRVSK